MEATSAAAQQSQGDRASARNARAGLTERVRLALSTGAAAVLGLLPHLLHHAGPLAGAALFAGVGGSLLFGVLGFVAAIPFLLHLRRRHQGWRWPAAALAMMVAVFSLSTFVIGPAISESDGSGAGGVERTAPSDPATESAHEAHH